MVISFTGHRDKTIKEELFIAIKNQYPGAEWVHGGAIGFDSQVEQFAKAYNISTTTIKPDYKKNGKAAPLIRNREIVDLADLLIACYDGRKKGGTFYTLNYAKSKNVKTHIVPPVNLN
jgi:hypothetical protein